MYIIMYHYVRRIKTSRYPNIKGLELEYFKKQLEFLTENDFQFVSLVDLTQGKDIAEKSVLLTFDDGYIDHYENVFPVLHEKDISGVFSMPGKIIREKKVLDVNKIHFILANTNIEELCNKLFKRMDYYRGLEFDYPSNKELYHKLAVEERFDNKEVIFIKRVLQDGLPERVRNIITNELFQEFVTDRESEFVDNLYMNMEQIKTMHQNGMEFAIHGYDHYWMNHLTKQQLVGDIEGALNVFDGIIDSKEWCCCYPYGVYNDEVIETIKYLGATSGLSTDVDVYYPQRNDIYKIPRLDTNDFPPKSDNYLLF